MNKIIIIITILILSSCSKISMMVAKRTGEFAEPQKETPASIMAYCKQMNVNYDQLYVLNSEEQFNSFLGKYKHIPGIFVFDKNKYLITTAAKSDCSWTMINFLYDSTIQTKSIADTSVFSEIITAFSRIDDPSRRIDADYYILCSWAKFTPKLTKSLFETINKQKQENKLNVCHILLNVDLQESWDKK